MKKTFGLLLLFYLSLSSCSRCKLETTRTIFYDGDSTGYAHYVLIEDYSRACMDSAEMVRHAQEYIDTMRFGRPIIFIKFFSSDDYFIPNEVSQPMNDIQRDCLVDISFDKEGQPKDFIFYTDRGETSYRGNLWENPDKR